MRPAKHEAICLLMIIAAAFVAGIVVGLILGIVI